ncbi:hypothetical protein Tco_0413704 [Tanacetum coccineum]
MRPSAIALGIILLLFPYKEDLRNLALFLAILMPVIILAIGRDLSFEGLDIKPPGSSLVLFNLMSGGGGARLCFVVLLVVCNLVFARCSAFLGAGGTVDRTECGFEGVVSGVGVFNLSKYAKGT